MEKLWLHILAAAVPVVVETTLVHREVLLRALAVDATAAAVFALLANAFGRKGRSAEANDIVRRCRNLLTEHGMGSVASP